MTGRSLRTVGRLAVVAMLASVPGCRCTPEVDDVDTRDESVPAGTTNGSQVAPEPVLASMWIPESLHPNLHSVRPWAARILADAIRTLHLMDLSTDPPTPTETLMATSATTWTFSVDGRPPHDVIAFHGQPRPGLDVFNRLFVDAYTNAGQRWMRDRGRPFAPLEPLREP